MCERRKRGVSREWGRHDSSGVMTRQIPSFESENMMTDRTSDKLTAASAAYHPHDRTTCDLQI